MINACFRLGVILPPWPESFLHPASTSAGSGLTSLPGPATHVLMPPSATMMGTTWCLSCLSTEMETTSCPTKLLDMNMPTCWILVSTHTHSQWQFNKSSSRMSLISPQGNGLFRSSWRLIFSRPRTSGRGSLELGFSVAWSPPLSACLLFWWEESWSATREGREHQATGRDSRCCKAALRKAPLRIRLLCNTPLKMKIWIQCLSVQFPRSPAYLFIFRPVTLGYNRDFKQLMWRI